jgi:hypothetical protein
MELLSTRFWHIFEKLCRLGSRRSSAEHLRARIDSSIMASTSRCTLSNYIKPQHGVDRAEAGPGPCQGILRALNCSAMRVTHMAAGPMRDLQHDFQPEE